MNYLIALLAFAAVMVVLSTLATVLVQAVFGVLGTRRAQFRAMLQTVYLDVLRNRLPELAEDGVEAFVDAVMTNPASPAVAGHGEKPSLDRVGVLPLARSAYAVDFETLDTRQFIEQLAHTPVGSELSRRADAALATMLDEVAHEYERLGQAARAWLAQRATAFALVTAVFVAGFVNVDVMRLYRGLAQDRALSEAVVEALGAEALANGATGVTERLETAVEALSATRGGLVSLGLPVGWDYFPYCRAAPKVDARCPLFRAGESEAGDGKGEADSRINLIGNALAWVVTTFIAAGFIGLGAPFWFHVFRSLGALLPNARKSRTPGASQPDGARPQDERTDVPAATSAEALLRAFRIAATTNGHKRSFASAVSDGD